MFLSTPFFTNPTVINKLLPNSFIRGVLLEQIPEKLRDKNILIDTFKEIGLPFSTDNVHIMKSRLGRTMGRAILLTESHESHMSFQKKDIEKIAKTLPEACKITLCDKHYVNMFAEQCYRYIYLSDDLRRLAHPENIHRVVTISSVPRSYGRYELSDIINKHIGVEINPENVVFRFTKTGAQDSTAWVIADSVKDANHIISKLQEVPVPEQYQYQTLMGTAFLYASRSDLFLTDASLDLMPRMSKYQIAIFGWHDDVEAHEIEYLLRSLKFYPKKVTKIPVPLPSSTEGKDSMVIAEFDRMKNTKIAMSRLQILKKRWKISTISTFYAYPKLADVHWEGETEYSDEDEADDSDLDEPIDY